MYLLGLFSNTKGYKCFSPDVGRHLLCVDVTFFETTPFFNNTDRSKGSLDFVREDDPQNPPNFHFEHPIINPINDSSPPVDPITNTPPPLRTYHRRRPAQPTDSSSDEHPSEHMVSPTTEPLSEPDDTSLPDSPPTPIMPSVLDPDLDRPVAERKGTRSTRNPYPIYNFLSYHRLSPSYTAFVSSLSSVSTPKNLRVALTDPRWR